jgi:hypothetical protein
MPDLHDVILAIETAFAERQQAAGIAPASADAIETRERA